MSTLAKLAVELNLDDHFSGGLAKVRGGLQEFGASMRNAGRNMTLGVTLPIVAAGVAAVKYASDQNEALSAVNTVYGKSAKAIDDWSKTTARSLGVSRTDALSAATTFAGVGKAAGIANSDLPKFSENLITAASDLGSFYNVDPGQVLNDLQSGLAGESEPLRKYNIYLNEASVAQKAMEMTGKANATQLTEGDKIAARSALILAGLGDAQGDFARTSNGLANTMRILKAVLQDIAARIGTLLLPYALRLAAAFGGLLNRVNGLRPGVQKLILIFAGVVAAVGPVLYLVGVLSTALAVMLSPIGLLVAGFVLIATKTTILQDAFRAVVTNVGTFINVLEAAFSTGTKISDILDSLFGSTTRVGIGMGAIYVPVKRTAGALETLVKDALLVADAFGDVVRAYEKGGFSSMLDAIPRAFTQISHALENAASGIGDQLARALSSLGGVISDAVGSIDWDAVGGDVAAGLKKAWEFAINHPGLIIGGAIGGVFGGAVGAAFGASIGAAIDSMGWGEVGTHILKGLQSAVASVPWREIWSGAKGIVSGLFDAFQNADYSQAGFLVGEGLRIAIVAAVPVIIDVGGKLIDGLLTGLQDHWKLILEWLALWPILLPAAIVGLAFVLLPKAAEFLGGFLQGLGVNWDGQVKPWLESLPALALVAIGDLTITLIQKGIDLLTGFNNGLVSAWPLVTTSISGAIAWILTEFVTAPTWLLAAGSEIITGLNQGLAAAWPRIVGSIQGAISWILSEFISSGTWLVQAGTNLINGLGKGIQSAWNNLDIWLSELPGKITSNFSGAGSWLYDEGAAIVQGLANGISAAAGAVDAAVNDIISHIPAFIRHQLGMASPSKVMMPLGGYITEGLAVGIVGGIPHVTRAMGRVAGAVPIAMSTAYGATISPIGGTYGSSGGGGGVTNNYGDIHISVSGAGDPDAVADRVFAKFSRSLQLQGAA